MAPDDRKIAEAIAARAEWMTELLARLVDKDTTLGQRGGGAGGRPRGAARSSGSSRSTCRWTPAALRAHPVASPFDWDVDGKRERRRDVVAGRSGHGGLSLILNGHIDVVSPEPRSQWARDPFTAHVEDDWLYGRGAADMKCGLTAILGAVKGLRDLGLSPHAPVHIAVGRRGGVHRQRLAADAARGVRGRRGHHRRAVRRGDHDVAGGGALVRRGRRRVCRATPPRAARR